MAGDNSSSSTSYEPVDLTTTQQSLSRAVLAKRAEYVRPRTIKIKIGSWNVAACPGTDKDLASWFVDGRGLDKDLDALQIVGNPAVRQDKEGENDGKPGSVRLVGGDDIGLYVLGLQEVVDLNMTKEYMNRAVYSDNGPMEKWKAALGSAMPQGYDLVVAEQMTGLLLLIYAAPDLGPTVSNVSTKQIGTGLLGYFGNKGAVVTRLVLGETTRLVFVNCHLASGADESSLDRRCWDVSQILTKTKFSPIVHSGVKESGEEGIGDEDFAFWFGDLNFRLEGLPGSDIRRILTLHARGEYDLSRNRPSMFLGGDGFVVTRRSESDDDTTTASSLHSREQSFDTESSLPDPDDFPQDPSQDPTSLQATLDSLISHDQLKRVIRERKAFHDGWREGAVTFLPSYKYDVGTVGLFDSSEKKRSPSWCDRILYRTSRDKKAYDDKIYEEIQARRKDEEMKLRGIDQDEDVLFSYNPDTDGEEQPRGDPGFDYDEYEENDNPEPEHIATKDGFSDHINLDVYTSHPRITSSDHKPIISVFTLDYNAVMPDLKAKVYAEVARELDRAENEGRPGITVVSEAGKGQDESAVDFGALGFLERRSCSLTVANTSGVSASFSFVETLRRHDDAYQPRPEWLTKSFERPYDGGDFNAEPLSKAVILEPGETVLVVINAQVSDIYQVRSLNDGSARLEDVLVLRVENGRDHFIPVRGTWLPSCFGRSIEELVRVPEGGIRKFIEDQKIKGSISYDRNVHCSAPKELFRLTEAIQSTAERCAADEAMLGAMSLPKDNGWPFDPSSCVSSLTNHDTLRAAVVMALDTDSSVLDALPVELPSTPKLELLCSVLLLFLTSLTDGILPAQVWAKVSSAFPGLASVPASEWSGAKTHILDVLSTAPNHNIAFVFLTSTLGQVATELSPATSEPARVDIKRRLSFRRGQDEVSRKRKSMERKYAEIVAPLACRSFDGEKGTRDKQRTMVEMFIGGQREF